jgi:hypothetical protein
MKSLIREYLRDYFPSNDNDWFDLVKSKKTLTEQIETAVLSLNSEGKMHGHQRRVGLRRLKAYAESLLSTENVDRLRKALRTKRFHNVYSILRDETKNHYMVSSLTAYDVAQRLCGAYGIEPEFIYLHTGTTVGAKILNIKISGKEYLQMNDLPSWISSTLTAADVENFLCIYKDRFVDSRTQGGNNCLPKKNKRIC